MIVGARGRFHPKAPAGLPVVQDAYRETPAEELRGWRTARGDDSVEDRLFGLWLSDFDVCGARCSILLKAPQYAAEGRFPGCVAPR